ncbi:unnamed protein product [Adineta ricciae]|uniref:RING-type domain-containing protein n=1 Tax=Adineta ricciae TaxID=249248 RepID=A0A814VE79_ADIRI|nr:unnamed protein product [Adineta ricciae]CAF1187787.1 unnamed protein product [Adineta ricciae]
MSRTEDIKPHYIQLNNNNSHETISDEDIITSRSSEPSEPVNNQNSNDVIDDDDYYAQFDWPSDEDKDFLESSDDENDEIYLEKHLNSKQMTQFDQLEQTPYQRSKRSDKKLKAQCQIKTKHAKSIRYNSHNKQLYMHHRLFKRVQLDPPSYHFLASPPPRCIETVKPDRYERNDPNKTKSATPVVHPSHQFREYTIHENNIPNEPAFDDAMIAFLLDMQNRDLSPNDYEMLLRLDERVQRKTVDKNVLNNLQTINVDETHLNEQCTICMETYLLGQKLKLLPCKHMFHLNCIETYLKEFSTQCPLDNMPLV